MNKVFLIGRLTCDPTERKTPNGKTVDSFTLAVDRPFTNANGEREADFISIVVGANQQSLYRSTAKRVNRLPYAEDCGQGHTKRMVRSGT